MEPVPLVLSMNVSGTGDLDLDRFLLCRLLERDRFLFRLRDRFLRLRDRDLERDRLDFLDLLLDRDLDRFVFLVLLLDLDRDGDLLDFFAGLLDRDLFGGGLCLTSSFGAW